MDEKIKTGELLNVLAETSPVGIVYVDVKGRIIFANSEAEKVLRLSKSEIANRTYNDPEWRITDFAGNPYPDEKLPFVLVQKLLKPVYDVQHAIKHADGSISYLSINASPLLDQKQKFDGMVATIKDITQQKKQEENLQQKTEQIETIWNVSHDLLGVADYHTATFIKVNPAFKHILGYEESELLSRPFLEFVHPDDVQTTIDVIEEKLKQGVTVIDFTNRYRCQDGSYKYLQWISRPIKERGLTYAIARDITQQKKQEENLQQKTEEIETMNEELQVQNEELNDLLDRIKESEETYRNIFQNAQVGLFRTRISDGKILESNEQLAKMFGYDDREKFIEEYFTSQNYVDAGTRDKMLDKIEQNGYIQNFEARFYRQDKSVFWARYSARVYPDKGWIEGVAEDVTNQRLAEESLRESNARNTAILAASPDLLFVNDQQGIFLDYYTNDDSSLYSDPEFFIGKSIEEVLPHIAGQIRQYYEKALTTKKLQIMEYSLNLPQGKRYFEARINAMDEQRLLTIVRDITDRKLAEISLKQEKEWSENIVNNAPNIIVGLGERSKIIVFNHYAERLTGYKAEEVIGKKWIEIFIPQELHETIYRVWNEIVENKLIDHHFENEIVTRSGEKRLIEWSNTILTEGGEFRMILSLGTDITERKQAEEALRVSEDRLSKIMLAANDGTWDWDLKTNEVYFDPRYYTMAGYEVDEFPHRLEEFQRRVHPDDIEKVMSNADKHLKGEIERFQVEFRFRKKTGDWMWINGRGFIVEKDAKGKPLSFVGTHQDITKRKKAEMKVKLVSENWHKTFDAINDGIALLDDQQNILQTNRTFEELVEKNEAELVNKKCFSFVHHTNFPIEGCPFTRTLKSKKRESMELKLNGFYYEITVDPILDEQQKIVGAVHIMSNITEEKETFLELERFKNELEDLVKERTGELEAKNAELKKNNLELERFNKLFVDREFRIKELREKVKKLETQLRK